MSNLAIDGGEPAIETPRPHDDKPRLIDDEIEAVTEYLENDGDKSVYGHDSPYTDFENRFLDRIGGEHAVLTNTGTSALNSAFFATGLEPGDEVIVPTYTFLATVMPIFQQGGTPVLADADPQTGNVDPESVAEQVTENTEAIAVTHLWGHPVDMDPILELADEHDLTVVEDCSHAHGAEYKGRPVGTLGDLGCFSLGSTKLVSGGECGIVITDDRELYERATLHGHFGGRAFDAVGSEYYQQFADVGYGQNYRAHPLGVVMADAQFDHFDEWLDRRNEKLSYFTERLDSVPGIEPPVTREYAYRGAYYGYKPAFVPSDFDVDVSLETYVEALAAEGMKVKRPGSKPLHTLEFFQTYDDGYLGRGVESDYWHERKRVYEDGDFPNAETYFEPRLSMPTFTGQDVDLVDEYVEAFEKVYEHRAELVDD